jgi:peptide/nickel transport system substrate-binding protein
MKRLSKFFVLGVIIALFSALVVPINAQDDVVEPAGPGEGGVIVEANWGGDPSTLNPLITADTVSSDVWSWFYPVLIAVDPTTFTYQPNQPYGMAAGWEYDESGTVLTVHLREDMFWSDGVQVTADDYIWAVNAVKSGTTSSTRTTAFYELDDGSQPGGPIHSVTKIDDFTIEIRMGGVETDENGEVVLDENGDPVLLTQCNAIFNVNDVTPVPAHVYAATFGDNYAAMDNDPYFFPTTDTGPATFGMFTEPFMEPGVGVDLLSDQNFPDTTMLDYVSPGGWFYQTISDSNVEYERFLAGDFTYTAVSPDRQNEFRALADETGDFQYIEYTAGSVNFMAFNTADPSNPQNGRDANGYIEQGLHPIFGDARVRQAINYGLNIDEMIGTAPDGDKPATGIMEGNGTRGAGVHTHPVFSTILDDLAKLGVTPRPYDLEKAVSLLEEAGWTDSDGDGVRECHGCLYATEVDASYEGSPMEFNLITNAGNVVRESVGETVRAQLTDLGMVVNFQAIDFGTLLDEIFGQAYDAVVVGGTMGLPHDVGDANRAWFTSGADIVGGGLNVMSYQNPDFDRLLEEADTLPGCDPDGRDALYAEAMAQWANDIPWIPLFHSNVMFAAQSNVENFDPLAYSERWNIDSWVITDK